MKRVGITLGDPCGIGPELVVRSGPKLRVPGVEFILYGSPRLLEKTAQDLDISPFWSLFSHTGVNLKPTGPDPENGIFPADDRRMRADAVMAMLDAASDDALAGYTSAIVTGPIDKSIIRVLLPSFSGHTEYLGEKAGVARTVMLLDNTELRVVFLTTHIPLRDVARAISVETIQEVVKTAADSLTRQLGISHPRFALASLNPHSGEIVENAEEETVFKPALTKLRKSGFDVDGPYPADSIFSMARKEKWDAVISPYHDQGMVAVKYNGLDKVVNITLGLPYLRVSPGHGVAYDLVGTRRADVRSFERAMDVAVKGRW